MRLAAGGAPVAVNSDPVYEKVCAMSLYRLLYSHFSFFYSHSILIYVSIEPDISVSDPSVDRKRPTLKLDTQFNYFLVAFSLAGGEGS
jgi:hypothetical protein